MTVTTQRTTGDWAKAMEQSVEIAFPQAEKIVLVLDNLTTHVPAALSKTFAPAKAKRLWAKLAFHYPPKHGSWLNIAELELSVLARQCLARHISDQTTLQTEVTAWTAERTAAQVTIHWHFTTADARRALPQVYPRLVPDTE